MRHKLILICPLWWWSPLRHTVEAQTNIGLPIVVEPVEAQTNIGLPIVVEPVEAQTNIAHCGGAR